MLAGLIIYAIAQHYPGQACGTKSDSHKMNKLSLITAIVASFLSLA
jgi:hypothetical protein